MILNAFAILAGFLAVLRLGLAVVLAVLALPVCLAGRSRAAQPARRTWLENRGYLLVLAAGSLAAISVLAWPLLYLVLESYIPHWPGVMCIYGVTQVGAGTQGASRHLPHLLVALEALKPALVLVSGGWLVLHLLNGRTATAPLSRRVAALVLVAAGLAVADAACEARGVSLQRLLHAGLGWPHGCDAVQPAGLAGRRTHANAVVGALRLEHGLDWRIGRVSQVESALPRVGLVGALGGRGDRLGAAVWAISD